MPKFKIAKLVRDQLAKLPTARGVRKLQGEELIKALKEKLTEEATECLEATTQAALLEEIADCQEVLAALAKAAGCSEEQLQQARLTKQRQKGSFAGGHWVHHMEVQDGTSAMAAFLANPKYEQLKQP